MIQSQTLTPLEAVHVINKPLPLVFERSVVVASSCHERLEELVVVVLAVEGHVLWALVFGLWEPVLASVEQPLLVAAVLVLGHHNPVVESWW